MNSLPAARRESTTTTLKKGRFLAPPRERRITTMTNLTEAEKGVILRELSTDWQGKRGLRRAMEKSKQKPREGRCPARGWKETAVADRSDGRFASACRTLRFRRWGIRRPPPLRKVRW